MSENVVTNNFRYIGNSPLDAKNSPISSVEDLYSIPMDERYLGMTIFVESESKEYWLKENISNSGWVIKGEYNGIPLLGSDVEDF